ncbi:MAG: hypothetical protein E7053_05300 [Lentisphaerae bacterium]|nr:hypothetical protein [Lentisphaerota bacterium]
MSESVYDGHIHMADRPVNVPDFLDRIHSAGIDGGLVISIAPAGLPDAHGAVIPARERMIGVRDFCEKCGKNFYPCFWIDVLEKDAVEQVKMAKEMGMRALKIICSHHYPSAGLPVYKEALKYDLPILFHSGILWDGLDSGKYNRPCEFECMLEVPGIRFSLAHISWPWTDECIALFGKLRNGGGTFNKKVDFFIDDCPGTPDIYRKDVFRKFALLGYDLSDSLIFGVDTNVHTYNAPWAKYTLEFDRKTFAELNDEVQNFKGYFLEESFDNQGLPRPDQNQVFRNSVSRNLLRFLGEKI